MAALDETKLQMQPSCDSIPATGMEHDTHWTAKARWMRAMGATDAAWSTEGQLVHLRLGAEPVAVDDDPATKQETAEARAIRERNERRRVATASSGGPVRRLSEGD